MAEELDFFLIKLTVRSPLGPVAFRQAGQLHAGPGNKVSKPVHILPRLLSSISVGTSSPPQLLRVPVTSDEEHAYLCAREPRAAASHRAVAPHPWQAHFQYILSHTSPSEGRDTHLMTACLL